MASWKKIIVSGSSANFSSLQVSNLSSSQVVIGGGENILTTVPINGSGNILATTGGTGVSMTGSFTGSFFGNSTSASNAQTASNIFPAILNNVNNYVLTATGNGNINGESNLIFNGTNLILTGSEYISGNLNVDGGNINTTSSIFNIVTSVSSVVNIGGSSTQVNVPGNLTVSGDLSVDGTTTFINTQNLYIKDRFVEIASGSTTLVDSGIISQYNAAGSGSTIFLSSTPGNYGRFAVAYDIIGTSTSVIPDEYITTVKINQISNPSNPPTWGNTGYGMGNLWITSAGDIFIYS